jgi:hypothetical protein
MNLAGHSDMNSPSRVRLIALFTLGVAFCVAAAFADITDVFIPQREDPAIEYDTRPVHDAVSKLNDMIEAGRLHLKFDGDQGYLRSVLEALNVPIESQMAVFSKTSVQARIIGPQNPRTLFFNGSVAVGWVRGGFVELAAQDPQQGIIFYLLSQTPQEKPRFVRHDECLSCHDSNEALGVPGMLVRSDFTAPGGTALRELGNYLTDHRSPLEQRWGGWYVTGNSGAMRHMGNALITDPDNPESAITSETLHVDSLRDKFDTNAYLSPYSDIAALMVFEHQMHMMNLFIRIGWQTRGGRYHHRLDVKALAVTAAELVDYMLFVDEAPLTNRIQGTSGFSEKFSSEGPRDSKGRSLRQLDLERRLVRYPCSYMIYSEAFDGLPPEAREAIYRRMWQILSGKERDGRYARLSLADRQAVVEILRETKKGLPDYFRPVTR